MTCIAEKSTDLRSPGVAPLGMILSQPAGETGVVAYELGCCVQLDESHCLLVASRDEQGGGDLCVGNDAFVFRTLADIQPERAIPVNRGDANYLLPDSGQLAFLAKFPAMVGFIPLHAKLEDGRPHPAAGRGFLKSTCRPFAADKTSAMGEHEPFFEMIEIAWDGKKLSLGETNCVRELMGIPLLGDGSLAPFVRQGTGLLVPFIVKQRRICVMRFEFNGKRWEPVAHGEPFSATPETTEHLQPGESWTDVPGECEPSMRKVGNKYYLYTRSTDPVGRLYESDDGLNFRLALSRENMTIPQVLNQGLDGSLYVATNPGPGWLRNPLVATRLLGEGDSIILHDQDGIRDDQGASIPFVDHAIAANVCLEGKWRHLVFYRVCDLKERSLHQFQMDLGLGKLIHGDDGPVARRSFTGLYAVELQYDRLDPDVVKL